MTEPTKEMKKWFYPAQKDAEEQLHKRFKSVFCEFQTFSENRVIEQFRCNDQDGSQPIQVQVLYRNYESTDKVGILIYELKYLQGWQHKIKF